MTKTPFELRPETLIKRVMSGTKEYKSQEYLEAFSKLLPSELHHNDFSRFDIIQLWNSLHKSPSKCRYFTFSLVHDNRRVQENIKKKFDNEKYAYILHDKDKSSEHKHFHYVLIFSNPRSFNSLANDLELPVTMIEKVYSKKGILDYLTHENDPNKYHYPLSDVVSNFDIEQEKNSGGGFPIKEFYHDYVKLRSGALSVDDFLDKYNTYFTTLSVSAALQVSERLFNASSTGAGLSTRSEFCGRTSVNNPLFQTEFPSIDPNKLDWLDDGALYHVASNSIKSGTAKHSYRKPNPRSDLNDVM